MIFKKVNRKPNLVSINYSNTAAVISQSTSFNVAKGKKLKVFQCNMNSSNASGIGITLNFKKDGVIIDSLNIPAGAGNMTLSLNVSGNNPGLELPDGAYTLEAVYTSAGISKNFAAKLVALEVDI